MSSINSCMHPSHANVETTNTYLANIPWDRLSNLTRFAPSPQDLLFAPHRLGRKIGSFIFSHSNGLGEQISNTHAAVTTAMADSVHADVLAQAITAGGDAIVESETTAGMAQRLSMDTARSFGNIFSYSTSRWAVGCMVMAVVLNRTMVYASTRRNVRLGWKMRFSLRILPVLLFIFKIRNLLLAIHCQTSPDFAVMRWNNANRTSDFMFNQNGGFLHTLSGTLLMGASDESSCVAINMVPTIDQTTSHLDGSLQQLWPLFKTLCFSQFIETLSCALQGVPVSAETGMTLFEHSLAFAEAEAAIGASLGWGIFGHIRGASSGSGSENDIKLSMIMKKVNTPPEVLLVGLLSSMNHLTSHILGIFNLQNRWRLLSTAFWAMCFMTSIVSSVWQFDMDDMANQTLLRFPTVVIIGFIPHILVFFGICVCAIIYSIAFMTTALATSSTIDGRPMTFMEKMAYARENMQANITLASFQISMRTDFYAALLKSGYAVLTVASDAVYLNESSQVSVKQRTWLEEARLKEIEDSGVKWLGPSFRGQAHAMIDDIGLVNSTDAVAPLAGLDSPFARERVTRKKGKNTNPDGNRNGVGAIERSGRWIMAFDFFVGIASLIASGCASIILSLLARVGFARRPRWLTWFIKPPVQTTKVVSPTDNSTMLEFWLLDDDGVLKLPADDNVDVEAEMRKRLMRNKPRWDHNDEQSLDSNLYSWFLNGGWFGSHDNSGQFIPSDVDNEDNTSVVSTVSEISHANDWESDSDEEGDGRRTPTQSSPQFSRESTPFSRESTPFTDTPLSHTNLATLLHPRTPEQRSAAQTLAAHLSSDRIVTRSQYRDILQRDRTSILTTTRHLPPHLRRQPGLSDTAEAEILEYIIRSKRAQPTTANEASGDGTWSSGAAGLGDAGPQCVVCQSAPRSIIVWPCRCLSLCDECRVDLAMNNFDKCVCCRRDVNSFSRIFVP